MTVSAFDGTTHQCISFARDDVAGFGKNALTGDSLVFAYKKNFRTHRALHLGVHNCEQWYRRLGNPYEVKVDI